MRIIHLNSFFNKRQVLLGGVGDVDTENNLSFDF